MIKRVQQQPEKPYDKPGNSAWSSTTDQYNQSEKHGGILEALYKSLLLQTLLPNKLHTHLPQTPSFPSPFPPLSQTSLPESNQSIPTAFLPHHLPATHRLTDLHRCGCRDSVSLLPNLGFLWEFYSNRPLM
uniref:Uncharacterized protein n=1 Tax=Opuntia streptacantha TaxID=393608 RepID=A0A7C8ZUI3_OPUST